MSVQVTKEVAKLCQEVGYEVKYRKHVFVKGKGEMPVYFVQTELAKNSPPPVVEVEPEELASWDDKQAARCLSWMRPFQQVR